MTLSSLLGTLLQTRSVQRQPEAHLKPGLVQGSVFTPRTNKEKQQVRLRGSGTFWVTDTWNDPLFLSGRCGFWRSAADAGSLEQHYLIFCVWEIHLLPSFSNNKRRFLGIRTWLRKWRHKCRFALFLGRFWLRLSSAALFSFQRLLFAVYCSVSFSPRL